MCQKYSIVFHIQSRQIRNFEKLLPINVLMCLSHCFLMISSMNSTPGFRNRNEATVDIIMFKHSNRLVHS